MKRILSLLFAALLLQGIFSCGMATVAPRASGGETRVERDSVSVLADKVWEFGLSRPEGFTLDVRTMAEPDEGIAVSYAATQDSYGQIAVFVISSSRTIPVAEE